MVTSERGFSLIELMIVTAISSALLGSAVAVSNQVQRGYSHELDDAAVQQEARYALDWIAATIAPAGSNPYDIATSACPASGTPFAAFRLDPDGNGIDDDIRVQADVNPPNGLLTGLSGACNESGEDVTIGRDAAANTITRRDVATDAAPVAVTDGVFTALRFTYLTSGRVVTATPDAIAFVLVSLTGRSRSRDPHTGQFTTFTYQSEIRVRSR